MTEATGVQENRETFLRESKPSECRASFLSRNGPGIRRKKFFRDKESQWQD